MGSFDRAINLFSNGSLYLISAPGHMSGHMVTLGAHRELRVLPPCG